MSTKRQRLTPEESRARAVEAARTLLLEHGPQAVTLKAVASAIGQTHANLLHHFGSVADLHQAVIEETASQIATKVSEAVYKRRHGEIEINDLVDTVFDCFDRDGAGRLATWMILTGDRQALSPVFQAVRSIVEDITPGAATEKVAELSLALTLSAIGDTLMGGPLTEALNLPRTTSRWMAAHHFASFCGLPLPETDRPDEKPPLS